MTEWSDKWLGDGVSPLKLRSKSSGERLSMALVDADGKRVKGSDVEMVIDPAYSKPGGKRRK